MSVTTPTLRPEQEVGMVPAGVATALNTSVKSRVPWKVTKMSSIRG